MTDGVRLRTDALRVVEGSGNGRGESLAAVVPARLRQPMPDTIEAMLGNVVPFMRPRGEAAAPAVVLPTDAARLPRPGLARERVRVIAFVALSLAVHGSMFAWFWREPEPLASIGIEVISAEIVLGATTPAGAEKTQGELQETRMLATDPEQVDPQREAEQKATEQAQNVQVAREETAPEQTTTLERQADERQPDDNAAAPREQTAPAEPKYSLAMVENPNTREMATSAPKEIPPDTTEISLLPRPEEEPVEKKPDPKPLQAAPPKPVKDVTRAKERRRIEAPTRAKSVREAKASSDPSTAASGVGVGRSSNDTNYRGLVSAHLARHKQYPSDARARGDGGTAAVTFTIGGGGGVSSVRLARGSGVPSIDQEVQAMVRRASPFPAPPDGRSVSFTVPVSFRLN
jgi:periplasmic protein TonB